MPFVLRSIGAGLFGAVILLGGCGGDDPEPVTEVGLESTPGLSTGPVTKDCSATTSTVEPAEIHVNGDENEARALYLGNSLNRPCAIVVHPNGKADVEIVSPNGPQPTDIRQWCAVAPYDPDALELREHAAPQGDLHSETPAYESAGGGPSPDQQSQAGAADDCQTVPIRADDSDF